MNEYSAFTVCSDGSRGAEIGTAVARDKDEAYTALGRRFGWFVLGNAHKRPERIEWVLAKVGMPEGRAYAF